MNRVKKRQQKLEGAQLKVTVMEAACQREDQVTGQKDRFKVPRFHDVSRHSCYSCYVIKIVS